MDTGQQPTAQHCIALRQNFLLLPAVYFQVTVDTRIPTNDDADPLFAKCKNRSEVWVPLLEKAYAKLHGSYEASSTPRQAP